MIVIPFYYFMNSSNLFLDVAIEQGLLGGLAFSFLYAGCVWLLSQVIAKSSDEQMRFFNWLGLAALIVTIVHGFSYDYLYNGIGSLLLFVPAGFSMIGVLDFDGLKVSRPQARLTLPKRGRINIHFVLVVLASLMALLALSSHRLVSIWYANLGAVRMSQIELGDFPTNRWVGTESAPDLTGAETLLLSALDYDPDNPTANHRLGLISMVRQDFETASVYLEKAHRELPGHRGIIKTLGYCYVWLGQMEKAGLLLAQIPEARHELGTYVWWWGTQHRADLAEKAAIMVSRYK
jgi:hypothetical protein